MYVLSRKVQRKAKEKVKEGKDSIIIRIGDDIIKITVAKVSGGRVTLWIEAPHGIRIVRGELLQNQELEHHQK